MITGFLSFYFSRLQHFQVQVIIGLKLDIRNMSSSGITMFKTHFLTTKGIRDNLQNVSKTSRLAVSGFVVWQR